MPTVPTGLPMTLVCFGMASRVTRLLSTLYKSRGGMRVIRHKSLARGTRPVSGVQAQRAIGRPLRRNARRAACTKWPGKTTRLAPMGSSPHGAIMQDMQDVGFERADSVRARGRSACMTWESGIIRQGILVLMATFSCILGPFSSSCFTLGS
jgi:hypothetical protein